MDTPRRKLLQTVGFTAAGVALAGCTFQYGSGDDDDDEEFQHVDEPPYEISEPDCPESGEDRDPLWLCANMAAEPSISFEQADTSGTILSEEGLQFDPDTLDMQFYATLLTEAADLDRIDRSLASAPVDLVEGTDFGAEAVLIAQTGWGSGTYTPHLKRLEEVEEGVHAHGCYRRPCAATDDVTQRTVVARFERPDALETATVSLTVDPETRVHFRTTDDVLTVESGPSG